MSNNICGIDFGGTNLRIGMVDATTGAIVGDVFSRDISGVSTNAELDEIIDSQVKRPCRIGICSAGTVDETGLFITKSPNSRIKGEITFGKRLKAGGNEVSITNDMKAAVQAAARYGEGKNHRNVLLATYSSGFNCAVVRDGVNVSTAEFGHLRYKATGDLFCGCGAKGHLEIYVSGNGAAAMARQFFSTTKTTDHLVMKLALDDWNKKAGGKEAPVYTYADLSNPGVHNAIVGRVGAKHVYKAFAQEPDADPQKSIRETQVQAIADSFGMMVSAYNPVDIIILMGSQTKDWANLFVPAVERYAGGGLQLSSVKLPPVVRTALPEIGVQGAAAYFLAQI